MDEEQRNRALEARRFWYTTGEVTKYRDLGRFIERDEMPPNDLLNTTDLRPQTDIDVEEVEIPARVGRGSSAEKWREFARLTSDMDPELIDSLTKEDLIAEMEAAGIIPEETEAEEE